MQASQELDRIIKSSDPAYIASTPASNHCISHSYNNTLPPDVSCSICGHSSAHFPIRSSSEVLGTSPSISTPQSASHAHNTSSGSYNTNRHSHSYASSASTQYTSNLTHSANASRQLRHRLSPHHSSYTSAPMTPSAPHPMSGVMQTPDSLIHMEAQSAANSVVTAFRELQAKTKMVESERTSACVIRDELRQELTESRRKHGLSRNKDEARSNKHIQSIKNSTDEQLVSYNYTRSVYQQQQDIEQSQTHKVEILERAQAELTNDVERLNSRSLRENLVTSREQSNSLEKVSSAFSAFSVIFFTLFICEQVHILS